MLILKYQVELDETKELILVAREYRFKINDEIDTELGKGKVVKIIM